MRGGDRVAPHIADVRTYRGVSLFRLLSYLAANLLADAIRDNPLLLEELPIEDEERETLKGWVQQTASLKALLAAWIRSAPGTLIRLLPLWLIIAAYVGGAVWAPKAAGHDYFVAAAGVIPVLLLALALETRILRFRWLVRFNPVPVLPSSVYDVLAGSDSASLRRRMPLLRKADLLFARLREIYRLLNLVGLAVVVLFMLSFSEWRCMNILASITDAKHRDPSVVSAGILAGLVGVGVVAIVGGADAE
jgi:hypothetical protein